MSVEKIIKMLDIREVLIVGFVTLSAFIDKLIELFYYDEGNLDIIVYYIKLTALITGFFYCLHKAYEFIRVVISDILKLRKKARENEKEG